MTPRKHVFISCGQASEAERQLGSSIAALIGELTPFAGYFAQNQSSLQGVAEHILSALDRAVGLVAVVHPRGEVATPSGTLTRASVWVEQEIAIASYIRNTMGRDLQIRVFIHRGIALEGLRQVIILNPVPFSTDDDIISDLRIQLPTWSGAGRRDPLRHRILTEIAYSGHREQLDRPS